MSPKTHKILLVDDDAYLLEAMQRILEDQYQISTAGNAQDGLELIRTNGPFAVVISDMRMPSTNGVQFLRQVMELSPKTIRIMLTGYANIEIAINAVNEGQVFRFVTKPCATTVMQSVIQSALQQYDLVIAEKELLEKTLRGAIAMLCEILSATNPVAFSRTMRVQFYAAALAEKMNLEDLWQYDVAALLSQIGCVTVPTDTLEKVFAMEELSTNEATMFNHHPEIAQKLVSQIPRLERIAQMIALQNIPFKKSKSEPYLNVEPGILVGAQILRAVTDFDMLLLRGVTRENVVPVMREHRGLYNPAILDLLTTIKTLEITKVTKMVRISTLRKGMILAEDVRSKSGLLLALRGQQVDDTVRRCLENYHERGQIKSEVRAMILQDAIPVTSPSP